MSSSKQLNFEVECILHHQLYMYWCLGKRVIAKADINGNVANAMMEVRYRVVEK